MLGRWLWGFRSLQVIDHVAMCHWIADRMGSLYILESVRDVKSELGQSLSRRVFRVALGRIHPIAKVNFRSSSLVSISPLRLHFLRSGFCVARRGVSPRDRFSWWSTFVFIVIEKHNREGGFPISHLLFRFFFFWKIYFGWTGFDLMFRFCSYKKKYIESSS